MATMPGFVGQRLRRARIARMMTGRYLAEQVGITPAAITRFEKGDACPRDEVVQRLADILLVPPSHFFNPLPPDRGAPVRNRSMSAATKRNRESAEVRLDWLREIIGYVAALMPLPACDLPDLHRGHDPNALSGEDIEEQATALRRAWGMQDGPIADMTALLESRGFAVTCFSLGAESMDALGAITPEAPIIIENTDRTTAVRMRFNLAHEVAHMVLHRHVPDVLASRPEIHRLMEHQAHRFAGAFMFPARSFSNEIYSVSVGGLIEAKRRWKLSVQTMVHRAFDLRLISRDQYERAFRNMSIHGVRRREPLDDALPSEQPSQVAQRIRHLIEQRGFSVEEIESHTRHRRREIEVLSSLPPGYFDAPAAPTRNRVVRLAPRPRA